MHAQRRRCPRVCFVTSTFFPVVGGGETHARLLCRELRRQGGEVFVLTRRTARDLATRDTVDSVPVRRVPPAGCGRLGYYLMLVPVFLELARARREYDAIVVSGLRILGLPAVLAARLFGKTCILRAASCGELSGAFIWDSPHLRGTQRRRWRLLAPLIALRNRLLRGEADGFLAISRAIGAEYRACGVPADRIAVINNGTDTDTFAPVDEDVRRRLERRLGLPAGRRVAAYAGKLNRGKGLEFLLEIWRAFAARQPDAHLVLIGSGKDSFLSCEEGLRAYVAANGLGAAVTFTGYVQNVHEWLQCADVFVLPSENESLSNALIEALACGLPCLASAVGGIPDTVSDGFNGRLLPAGDRVAWLEALAELWSRPELAARWGRQGRQGVLRRNAMPGVAERHMTFFAECAARRRQRG